MSTEPRKETNVLQFPSSVSEQRLGTTCYRSQFICLAIAGAIQRDEEHTALELIDALRSAVEEYEGDAFPLPETLAGVVDGLQVDEVLFYAGSGNEEEM